VPRPFCVSWNLRPKVLAIVDPNSAVIDGRMKTGDATLAKLHPQLTSLQLIDADLEGYVQYPGSDCRNGGLLRVRDGRKLMKSFYSHHYCLLTGRRTTEFEQVARVMDLEADIL